MESFINTANEKIACFTDKYCMNCYARLQEDGRLQLDHNFEIEHLMEIINIVKQEFYIYVMLNNKISVGLYDDNLDGKNICWRARTGMTDCSSWSNLFALGDTAIDAVWNLRKEAKLKGVKL
jgi:hypothetical protein